MGIKLGSVVEILDSKLSSYPEDVYEILRTDPDDLYAPFLGVGENTEARVWFTARGEVFNYEDEITVEVVRE